MIRGEFPVLCALQVTSNLLDKQVGGSHSKNDAVVNRAR